MVLEGRAGEAEQGWAETWARTRTSPSVVQIGAGSPLTACLHQEQLMATISLLWKVNFCWKPCG